LKGTRSIALRKVDAHGDVAPVHVQDPMTMVLRQRAIFEKSLGKIAGYKPPKKKQKIKKIACR
jgi:hypothetical protein